MRALEIALAVWLGMSIYFCVNTVFRSVLGQTKVCAHGYVYTRALPVHEYRQLIDDQGRGVKCQ